MLNRKILSAAVLAMILAATMASSTRAMGNAQRTNYLTFSGSFQLPGKTLGPGTYIFELPDPENAWNLVRVSSRDRKTVYLTAFTMVVPRPSDMPHGKVAIFGEGAKGTPPPLRAWYPQDDVNGREFIY